MYLLVRLCFPEVRVRGCYHELRKRGTSLAIDQFFQMSGAAVWPDCEVAGLDGPARAPLPWAKNALASNNTVKIFFEKIIIG